MRLLCAQDRDGETATVRGVRRRPAVLRARHRLALAGAHRPERGVGGDRRRWVTQRDGGDANNVQAFTIGSLDDLLTGPLGVGTGGFESYGIAVTPNDQYVYVTDDNGQSTVSQYSVSPTTGALSALSPASATVSASAGANPESIAIDPTGSWAFTANEGSGTVSTLRIAPSTGELTIVQEIATGLTQPTGIATDPSGHYVYATDFASDEVTEFSVDLTTGALTELGR